MSGPARAKRLARELQECKKDTSIEIEQVNDSIDHFVGSFPGPTGTSYEGGWFKVDIQAPERYPFEPLKMKFITKVYHPNVSSASGYICLDILKTSWSPVYTLRTCLVSLQSLLSTPEPSDPQDAQVANHYLKDREGFEETAKFWTEVYAAREKKGESKTSTASISVSRPHSPSPSPSTTTNDPSSKRPRLNPHTSSDDSVQIVESPRDPLENLKKQCRLSGLEWTDVETFTQMGFDSERVIEVLGRLNWRKGNRERCSVEEVVSRLIE
ncbi:uncharacterized protein JCM6883_007247 [Sporobolomyces salmoneus]|uniref:uncharacterized protein n=1 Tax=Sporobolomyces salmoneus TaxID=183962 RepID=UPI003179B552